MFIYPVNRIEKFLHGYPHPLNTISSICMSDRQDLGNRKLHRCRKPRCRNFVCLRRSQQRGIELDFFYCMSRKCRKAVAQSLLIDVPEFLKVALQHRDSLCYVLIFSRQRIPELDSHQLHFFRFFRLDGGYFDFSVLGDHLDGF